MNYYNEFDPKAAAWLRSLRWSQCFLYGWKGDDDKLHMQSIRPIDGTWHIPTEFSI